MITIRLEKINKSMHRLAVVKQGKIFDHAELDTKTFFLHDVVHYCVEAELGFRDGFWGMIDQGYKIAQLAGKNNELTAELRLIEKVVGPVQSVFSGHIQPGMLGDFISVAGFSNTLDAEFVARVTRRIGDIMHQWKYLPVGGAMELDFGTDA